MSSDTLVLNRNYYAVHISNWKKAVSLLYQGHAQAVDENLQAYDFKDWVELSAMMTENAKGFVNSVTMRVAIPEVIRLTRYDKLPRQDVKFSRRNIFEHYKRKCCYCGVKVTPETSNWDHVIPKSKGGVSNWTNIVLSCYPCNTKKDDKTPKEAGMALLIKPSRPKWQGAKTVTVSAPLPIPVSWQNLIDRAYWDGELQKS
jgi:5-methylcytosine-specific restriction endonuclease McrA